MSVDGISVIVPVYNAERFVERSLRSLIEQTVNGIEIVVVDDASQDGTVSIVERVAVDEPSIVFVKLSQNVGVHEARLEGLKYATSEWIGFLDADDIAHPDMYKKMLCTAIDEGVDIVVCGAHRVNNERKFISEKFGVEKDYKVAEDVFSRFCRFEFGTGTLWNKVFRRKVIEPYFSMHFPWRQNTNEDLVLNVGCFLNASSVYVMKEFFYEYVDNSYSATSELSNIRSFVDIYKAFMFAVSLTEKDRPNAIYDLAMMYRERLSWRDCAVSYLSQLEPFHEELNEAARVVSSESAFVFAMLASSPNSPCHSIKGMMAYCLNKVISKAKAYLRYLKLSSF